MRLTDLKRPRIYLPIALTLILIGACAVVFHPAFQRKMLLDQVGPLVDSLEIGHILLTPWSLDLSNLVVGYRGGHLRVGEASLKFCLSCLLLRNANLKAVLLRDVEVDLAAFEPPQQQEAAPPTGLFPGVLASLEHGLSYTLGGVLVDAVVRLPKHQSMLVRLQGGGIGPEASGNIGVAVSFHTGAGQDHIDLNGELSLDQLTRGRFRAVEATLDITAFLADLPATESVHLKLAIAPAASPAGAQDQAAEHGVAARYTPERVQLSLQQDDSEGNNRSTLDLQAAYDGNSGGFEGDYRVTANDRWVRPYLRDAVLPPTQEVLTGHLNFDVADFTGDITVLSDLLVRDLRATAANQRLPDRLRLANNFRLSLLADRQLRVETLDADVSDDDKHQPLSAKLPADLDIPLDDIKGFLKRENTLLEFELPGVPLAWFDVLLPDQDITRGNLTAAFRVTTDAKSAIHLKPLKALKVTGLTLRQHDQPLVEDPPRFQRRSEKPWKDLC